MTTPRPVLFFIFIFFPGGLPQRSASAIQCPMPCPAHPSDAVVTPPPPASRLTASAGQNLRLLTPELLKLRKTRTGTVGTGNGGEDLIADWKTLESSDCGRRREGSREGRGEERGSFFVGSTRIESSHHRLSVT